MSILLLSWSLYPTRIKINLLYRVSLTNEESFKIRVNAQLRNCYPLPYSCYLIKIDWNWMFDKKVKKSRITTNLLALFQYNINIETILLLIKRTLNLNHARLSAFLFNQDSLKLDVWQKSKKITELTTNASWLDTGCIAQF